MSKTIDILNLKGEKVGAYEIADTALEMERGAQAVHDAVVAFMNECRAGTASTKTRGEVSGGGKKPKRQKGLGGARAGSSRNPVWRGGGVVFGPKPRDYSQKINAKVKKLALKRSFSDKVQEGNLIIVDQFVLSDCKTKSAVAVLKALNADKAKVMISVAEYDDEKIIKATGNLAKAFLMKASTINTYQVLYFDKLLFTKDALDEFVKRLA